MGSEMCIRDSSKGAATQSDLLRFLVEKMDNHLNRVFRAQVLDCPFDLEIYFFGVDRQMEMNRFAFFGRIVKRALR